MKGDLSQRERGPRCSAASFIVTSNKGNVLHRKYFTWQFTPWKWKTSKVSIARCVLLKQHRCLSLKCTTISGNYCFANSPKNSFIFAEERTPSVGRDVCFFLAFFPSEKLVHKSCATLPTVLSAVCYTVISLLFSCSATFPNQAPTLRWGCCRCTASI